MFTSKSYIFYCALSLKLSTYDFDIAEITDKTATLKTQHSFFSYNSKTRRRNFLLGRVFSSEKYYFAL